MVKKSLIVLIALLSVVPVTIAQTTVVPKEETPVQSTETGKWAVGIDIAGSLNIPAVGTAYMKSLSYGSFIGGSYGVNVRYNPYRWLSFRVGAQRVAKNYSVTRTLPGEDGETPTYGSLIYNTFWDVPVWADLSIGRKVRWHLFLGAYVGFWSKSSVKGTALPLSTVDLDLSFNESYTFDNTRDNRFDAGLNYGLGLSIPCSQHFGIDVEALWYYGLTDLQKPYMRELNPMYNTTILLQVGANYRF